MQMISSLIEQGMDAKQILPSERKFSSVASFAIDKSSSTLYYLTVSGQVYRYPDTRVLNKPGSLQVNSSQSFMRLSVVGNLYFVCVAVKRCNIWLLMVDRSGKQLSVAKNKDDGVSDVFVRRTTLAISRRIYHVLCITCNNNKV